MDYDDAFKTNNLVRRTDKRYKVIENFQPYELTHCIIFEMAIRNKDIKQSIDLLAMIEKVLDIKYKQKSDNDFIGFEELEKLNEDSIEVTEEEFKQLEVKRKEYLSTFEEGVKILKNEYYLYFNQNSINIPEIENSFKEKDFTDMSIEEVEEEFENALRSPIMKHVSGGIGKFLNGEKYPHYKSDHNIYEGFVTARGIDPKCKTFDVSNINTHFQRKVYDTNQINVALNMSLPEEELVQYIKHIKKTLSKPNTKGLKSPNNLLGNKVQTVKTIKNYPKKPTASKLADMFFVYDYVTKQLDDYSSNGQDSINNEIFDDLESEIPIAYYLETSNKKCLDRNDINDKIFEELVSPLYREKIKQVQRKYNKKTIHTNIDAICKDFKDFLDQSELSVIQKRYSIEISNPKKNKIFEDLESILYSKHIKNISSQYKPMNKQIEKTILKMENLIKDYKFSSSTVSNYYYAIKPYIEERRYTEFLTGESIIEDEE